VYGQLKHGQSSKRVRGRSSGRRGGGNRQQVFDSNGPSVRIRGNAFQVHEKYLTLARDAASSGDRIAAENYYQHAEHYFRIHSADQEERTRQQSNGQGVDGPPRRAGRQPREGAQPGSNGANGANGGDQPELVEPPVAAVPAGSEAESAEEEGVLRTLQVGGAGEKGSDDEAKPKKNGQDRAAGD
jgi:hypothetical protein